MRVYLALCCIALAIAAVSGNFCAGDRHDDPTPCASLLTCGGTTVLGCQEHVCTCVAGKKHCTSKSDCAGVCHADGHTDAHAYNEHCIDGLCDCASIHH